MNEVVSVVVALLAGLYFGRKWGIREGAVVMYATLVEQQQKEADEMPSWVRAQRESARDQ